MSGFLTRLAQRTLSETPGLTPRPRSRFEPAPVYLDRERGLSGDVAPVHEFQPGATFPEADAIATQVAASPSARAYWSRRDTTTLPAPATASSGSSTLSATRQADTASSRPALTARTTQVRREADPTHGKSHASHSSKARDVEPGDAYAEMRVDEAPQHVAARATSDARLAAPPPAAGTGGEAAGLNQAAGDPFAGEAQAPAALDADPLHSPSPSPVAVPSPAEARQAPPPETPGRSAPPDPAGDPTTTSRAPERAARPASASPAFPPAFMPPTGAERASRVAAEATAPPVEVRIGRIEVRAELPPTPAPPRGQASALAHLPSLADHLARQRGR